MEGEHGWHQSHWKRLGPSQHNNRYPPIEVTLSRKYLHGCVRRGEAGRGVEVGNVPHRTVGRVQQPFVGRRVSAYHWCSRHARRGARRYLENGSVYATRRQHDITAHNMSVGRHYPCGDRGTGKYEHMYVYMPPGTLF